MFRLLELEMMIQAPPLGHEVLNQPGRRMAGYVLVLHELDADSQPVGRIDFALDFGWVRPT